ncbi:MAG: Fe-S cluster assembly protein SufD [Streptosporangiales bacterium]|nr:Fe-S cluster assembly protein SufD [Streptosporangiales bacterium]MBO0892097.1 Fe-S cluster assembly protein SufD [Acidothermales bacterium]
MAPHSHGGGAEAEAAAQSKLHATASYDVADFAVPAPRDEQWRFTPLARLRGLHDGSAKPDGGISVEVDAPAPVTVETVGRDDPRIGRAGTPTDRIAAQAWTSFEKATVVTVPQEARPDRPVGVSLRGEQSTGYGHIVVDVQPLAEVTVVLDHSGSATYAGNVEVNVADGAQLTLVSLQDWDDDAVHVAHQYIRLGRDARVKSVVVTFGGDLVRLYPQVRYGDRGGDAELYGLYFADAPQHLEHRLFVDHDMPDCRSRVAYKGALQGEDAHTVWIGDVLIRPDATGTDTYELNRNLVLTDGARADSVPNLEILTGEIVGAGHASATGRFDEEQLFYLQSRGIPELEARRLVVRGFFADIIQQIHVPEVRDRLVERVEEELQAVGK